MGFQGESNTWALKLLHQQGRPILQDHATKPETGWEETQENCGWDQSLSIADTITHNFTTQLETEVLNKALLPLLTGIMKSFLTFLYEKFSAIKRNSTFYTWNTKRKHSTTKSSSHFLENWKRSSVHRHHARLEVNGPTWSVEVGWFVGRVWRIEWRSPLERFLRLATFAVRYILLADVTSVVKLPVIDVVTSLPTSLRVLRTENNGMNNSKRITRKERQRSKSWSTSISKMKLKLRTQFL